MYHPQTEGHLLLCHASLFSDHVVVLALLLVAKLYATIRNKKGDKGSSCLNPLNGLNFVVELPLTKIVTDFIHPLPMISTTHVSLTYSSCNRETLTSLSHIVFHSSP